MRPAVREDSFLHAGQKYVIEFEPLGAVQRHQRDQRVLIEVVGVTDQSGVIEEIHQRFAALGPFRHGVGEFAQVVGARGVFARIAIHEHVEIAAAEENGLQKIRGRGRVDLCLEALDQFPEILERSGGAAG